MCLGFPCFLFLRPWVWTHCPGGIHVHTYSVSLSGICVSISLLRDQAPVLSHLSRCPEMGPGAGDGCPSSGVQSPDRKAPPSSTPVTFYKNWSKTSSQALVYLPTQGPLVLENPQAPQCSPGSSCVPIMPRSVSAQARSLHAWESPAPAHRLHHWRSGHLTPLELHSEMLNFSGIPFSLG